MIWDDIKGSHEYDGSSSTSDSMFKQRGYAESLDGRRYDYQLQTTDEKTTVFTIDGTEYDLSQGALFLITTKGGTTRIQQLNHDLSDVVPTNEGCETFAKQNLDVAEFISQSEKP